MARKQKQRLLVIIVGACLAFCLCNYYAEWRLFAPYDVTAIIVCTAVGFILARFFGPELYENEDMTRSADPELNDEIK
jgi:hypothetical protein